MQKGAPEKFTLGKKDAALAEALANYGMGVLREGAGDPGGVTNYLRAAKLEPNVAPAYIRAAVQYLRRGEGEKAIQVAQEACRRNPRLVEARIYLAQICMALNQPKLAQQACLDAIKIDPRNFKGHVQLAAIYTEQKDLPRALATLEEALHCVEDQRPVLRFLGDLHAQQIGEITVGTTSPELEKAIYFYEQAAEQPHDDLYLTYLRRLGDLYILNRQIEEAIECFAVIGERHPDDAQAKKKLALCYMAVGNKEQALECLKSIAGREPQNYEVQFYLGQLFEAMGDVTNATACFLSASETTPANPLPYLRLALLYMKNAPDKASDVLQSGLRRLPEDKQLFELLANLYLKNRQNRQALETFEKLYDILSRQDEDLLTPNLFVHYGMAAQMNKLPDKAIALYERALEIDPYMLDAYTRLAFLYLGQAKPEEALRMMARAIQLMPDNPNAYYYLGLLNLRAEKFEDAITAFKTVEKLAAQPGVEPAALDADFFFNYGAAYERAGHIAEAEARLQQAIALDPENAEALNYLAYMWAEKGLHLDAALELVNSALALEPENGAFIDTLGWIYFKQGESDDALEMIHAALQAMPDDPTINEHMGDILAARHQEAAALEFWKLGFRLNIANKPLEEKLQAKGADLDSLRQQAIPKKEPAE